MTNATEEELKQIFELLPTRQHTLAQLKHCQSTKSTLSDQDVQFLIEFTLSNDFLSEAVFFLQLFVERQEFSQIFKFFKKCGLLKKVELKNFGAGFAGLLIPIFLCAVRKGGNYGCEKFILLEIVSSMMIMNRNQRVKSDLVLYFNELSTLLLISNYFYSYLNCLYLLNEMEKRVEMSWEGLTKIVEILKIKNEGPIFKNYFCGFEMNAADKIIEKLNRENCNETVNLDEKWMNFNTEVEKNEENELFLRMNGLEYKENEKLNVIGHNHKSITARIFEIKNKFQVVEKVLKKEDSRMRDMRKINEQVEKTVKPKKLKQTKKKKDYFTRHFNLFRLYRNAFKSKECDESEDEFTSRCRNYEVNYDLFIKRENDRKQELMGLKELVEQEYDSLIKNITETKERERKERERLSEIQRIEEKRANDWRNLERLIPEDRFKETNKFYTCPVYTPVDTTTSWRVGRLDGNEEVKDNLEDSKKERKGKSDNLFNIKEGFNRLGVSQENKSWRSENLEEADKTDLVPKQENFKNEKQNIKPDESKRKSWR